MVSHVIHLIEFDVVKVQGFVHRSLIDYEGIHVGYLVVVSRFGNYVVGYVPMEQAKLFILIPSFG